jgi:hypothetical protein
VDAMVKGMVELYGDVRVLAVKHEAVGRERDEYKRLLDIVNRQLCKRPPGDQCLEVDRDGHTCFMIPYCQERQAAALATPAATPEPTACPECERLRGAITEALMYLAQDIMENEQSEAVDVASEVLSAALGSKIEEV